MILRKYADLGTVYRGKPCEEYPGEWLSYLNGNDEKSFATFEEAYKDAFDRQEASPSVSWKCSDNDPRIGEVWFTGYYQHGRFDIFGRYIS